MNSNDSSFSATTDESSESYRSLQHDTGCQESPKPETQGGIQSKDSRPPQSSGVAGSKSAVQSSPKHDNRTCGIPGCERTAEDRQMSHDDQGGIERVCLEHKKPSVAITAMTRAAHCEFAGCERTPRYGPKEGPLSFCQAHKRAGQYTVRNGQLFVATRDGSAFRDNSGTTAVGAAATVGVVSASAAATALPRESNAQLPAPGSAVPSLQISKAPKKKKNRPCIFPGCEIRPHYGFLGERSLFCVTHKKEGMVHLLRASKNLQKEAESRGRLESRLHVTESKAGPGPKKQEKAAVAAEDNIQKQKDRERESNAACMGGQKGKMPAESKKSARKGFIPDEATQEKEQHNAITPSPASSREKESPLPTRPAEAPGLPPSGLAPSDEIRLLQEARESARAAAEASGSGRRPRAPSRKLLEASGKLMCDSIQWMTKEKREEEARVKQEMKEQRKAAAAAGLKFGQRMEALTLSTPAGARAEGGVAETTAGEIAGAGPQTGMKAAGTSVVWRKLTPAETLIAAGKQPHVDGAQQHRPGSKVRSADKLGERISVTPASVAKPGVSERKRKAVASARESTIQAQGAREFRHSRRARRRVDGGDSKWPTE
eukprot:g17401.t1